MISRALFTAALTVLVGLGVPDGQAAAHPIAAGLGFGEEQNANAVTAPNPSPQAVPTSNRAASMMGEDELPDVPILTEQRFSTVDAGGSATCAILKGSHQLLCWGLNNYGQASPPIGTYQQVSMGEHHGCALRRDRRLRCWGLPEALPGVGLGKGRYLAVASGDDHTCAIRLDKRMECWGDNSNGELNIPTDRYTQLDARGDHTCAINTRKQLLCWGEEGFTSYAQKISEPIARVATGQLHACVLRASDGRAFCWGNGLFGEAAPPSDRFIDIIAGDWHTCGLKPDRTTVCWGRNQYGQTHVGMAKFLSIAAGGAQTCGILRGDNRLKCRGSFASNDVFYPQDIVASRQAYQEDGLVRPQLAFLAIFQGVSAFLESGIVNTGKILDNKPTWETKGAQIQVATLFVNMFLGWFLPEKPDRTYELLKDIQVDIKNIEKGVDEANRQINNTQLKVVTAWCDAQLRDYTNAYNLLDGEAGGEKSGARAAYLKLLKKQEASLTQAIETKSRVPFPTQELLAFKSKYLGQLKTARSNLVNSLLSESGQSSPLLACFEKGYGEWKQSMLKDGAGYLFDDRAIYKYAYRVLRGALLMQGEILNMELDLGMHEAYDALTVARLDGAPAIDFNPVSNGLGFCLYADQQAQLKPGETGYSPRWPEVAQVCAENRQRIKQAYIDMVNQVEELSGAYSDEQVVLSLTAKQVGLEEGGERNWLWMRHVPAQNGAVYGWRNEFDKVGYASPFVLKKSPPPFPHFTDAALYYFNEGSFEEGVWHSNGLAWQDAFRTRELIRGKSKNNQDEDVLERMSQLEDMTQEACQRDASGKCKVREIGTGQYEIVPGPRPNLFSGFEGTSFWMSGNYSYTFDARSKTEGGGADIDRGSYQVKFHCFVASAINKGGWYHPSLEQDKREVLKLSGKVCSTEEMAAMIVRYSGERNVGPINCSGYNADGRCIGIGISPLETKRYRLYEKTVGKWIMEKYVEWDGPLYAYQKYKNHYLSDFKPWTEGPMYHMPVVNVNDRKCKNRLTSNTGQPGFFSMRIGAKLVDGVSIPTICGADMDKTIRELIPRPEYPPIDVREVRLPDSGQ
jgi:hypothetical protein